MVRFSFDDPFGTLGPLARKESLSSSHPRLHAPSNGVPKPKPMLAKMKTLAPTPQSQLVGLVMGFRLHGVHQEPRGFSRSRGSVNQKTSLVALALTNPQQVNYLFSTVCARGPFWLAGG